MMEVNFIELQHFHLILFLASSLSLFHATVSQPEAQSGAPHIVNDNANPSLTILLVVVVLIFAFFILGFYFLHIRQCYETYFVPGSAIGPRGIDPEVLQTFPIMVYSTVKNLKVKTGHNVALQCAVCLSEFKDLDTLRLLPKCSHVFHPDCIDAWLASHLTCPVCRANLQLDCAKVAVEIREGGDANHVFDESSVRRGEGICEGSEGGVSEGIDGCVGKDNGSSKMGDSGVLVRSHSTGHSLVEHGKVIRKHILDDNERGSLRMINRSASYDVVWKSEEEECSRIGGSEGGEGSSSKGRNQRWVLSMTPPFVSRGKCSSTFSGIPRLWREDHECERRTSFLVL